jgi:hypothetical protein
MHLNNHASDDDDEENNINNQQKRQFCTFSIALAACSAACGRTTMAMAQLFVHWHSFGRHTHTAAGQPYPLLMRAPQRVPQSCDRHV